MASEVLPPNRGRVVRRVAMKIALSTRSRRGRKGAVAAESFMDDEKKQWVATMTTGSDRQPQPGVGLSEMLRLKAIDVSRKSRVNSLRLWATLLEIEMPGGARIDVSDSSDQSASGTKGVRPEGRPEVSTASSELERRWLTYSVTTVQSRTVPEAKTDVIRRLGDVALAWSSMDDAARETVKGLYRDLFSVAVEEEDYAVQLEVTHQVARGGVHAFDAIQPCFADWWLWWNQYWCGRTANANETWTDLHATVVQESPNNSETWLELNINSARASLATTGGGSDCAGDEESRLRQGIVCAWLAPLLHYHAGVNADTRDPEPRRRPRSDMPAENPSDNLRLWIFDFLARTDPTHPDKRPWISLEMALAQGFRHAANIRPRQTSDEAKRRTALIEQAEAALKHSRFWFAQLVLIQALALLSLPDDPTERFHNQGHGSDPSDLVRYWLKIAGMGFSDVEHRSGHRIHPLVREAAWLARDALLTRDPASYCWIDEAGTIAKVGSRQRTGKFYEHQLWILPSAGWSGLTQRARQVLGDVMLMLNLTERGTSPASREERLKRADRPDLPPCLTRDPSSLAVLRTVDSAKVSGPGSNCHDRCQFRLCPYPPVGERTYRSELSEGFCRTLSIDRACSGYKRRMWEFDRTAFWQAMAHRAQPGRSRKRSQLRWQARLVRFGQRLTPW